jgi:hypothetical protein
MVTIVKHEWHQHDRQYAIEIDEDLLSEIYPDLDEDEIAQKLADIESGEIDYEEVLDDASNNDVEIEWEFQYDDCWTDRKGGYDVTYELGDESSWHSEPEPDPPTHKCTNCKWEGSEYEAEWSWEDSDGKEIDEPRKICKYCSSDTELTEFGIQKAKESAERTARWAKEADEEADEEPVDEADLEEALEDLKREFEELTVNEKKPAKWPFDNAKEVDTVVTEDKTSTHWPTPDSDFTETAKWPFEDDDKDEGSLKESYPADTYTIRVWGRTREIGVSKIKKAQYDYWSDEDHEDDLSDALNENYDYDENETPKAAQFELPYYEYQDKHSFWGFDQDDTHMTITNSEGEEIYEGDLESFFSEAHGEEDSRWETSEEQDELYPEHLGKGYWLMWTQGGKGSCIQTSIEGVFEPKKLKVFNWDVQGTSVVTRLVYDGDELDDEGMDSEHDNWRGQWSQFDVYHNKK